MTTRALVPPSAIASIPAPARDGTVRGAIGDAIPAILGLAPLALALGATIADGSLPVLTGWLTAPLLYGGSAQFAALSMLGAGAAATSVVMTVAVVNARGLFYSAALRPSFRAQPLWFRLAGPYLLVDPLFALMGSPNARSSDPSQVRGYYLSAGLAIWASWLLMIAAGVIAGSAIPSGEALGFAVPALLIGFLVPSLKGYAALVATAVALLIALGPGPSGGASLLVAGAAGAAAGALVDRRRLMS